MKKTRISLKKESKGAAHASQEQVLPLVGELEDAELDFVAGGNGMDSSVLQRRTQEWSRNASPTSGETARPWRHFSH
jgi:hypothetical protein